MIRHLSFSTALLTALLAFLPGCQTGKDPSAFVSVQIEGKTYGQVRLTIVDVFEENGFERQWTDKSVMTFQRAGSRGSNIMYGGWEPNTVGDRAKVRMESAGTDAFIVVCEAFRVSDMGDRMFEEEKRLGKAAAGKYRPLLEEVKRRLDTLPPGY